MLLFVLVIEIFIQYESETDRMLLKRVRYQYWFAYEGFRADITLFTANQRAAKRLRSCLEKPIV